MTKYEALVNAQSVYSWAVLFGHGELHDLTYWGTWFCLIAHFPYDSFDRGRENQKFRQVVMAGAEIVWEPRPDLGIWVLRISWRYSK